MRASAHLISVHTRMPSQRHLVFGVFHSPYFLPSEGSVGHQTLMWSTYAPPCAWETVMLVECATLPGHHVMRCHMAALNVSPHIPQGKSIATGATGGQCREKKAPAFSSGRWPAKGTNAAAPHGEGWDTAAPQARAADQSQPMSARPCRALLKSDAALPHGPSSRLQLSAATRGEPEVDQLLHTRPLQWHVPAAPLASRVELRWGGP